LKKDKEMSIYEYLINTLTKLNLLKVYGELDYKNNLVDEIKADTLAIINGFEEIKNFDPRANITLTIKLVLKHGNNYLVKIGKKYDELITFNPSLTEEICTTIAEEIKKIGDICVDFEEKYEFINAYSIMQKDKSPLKNPSYIVLAKGEIKEIKNLNDTYKEVSELDRFNELDLAIIERR
jgi:hypothetical protein